MESTTTTTTTTHGRPRLVFAPNVHWTADEIKTQFKGCRTSRPIDNYAERKLFSTYLFNKNTTSDEYYTQTITWQRYINTRGLHGIDAYEPFSGDGGASEALGTLVNLKFDDRTWDFYDKIRLADRPTGMILTNPPFSFKYHIIVTLCELRLSFAMILPWQTFLPDRHHIFDKYERKYGGTWRIFKLKGKEHIFRRPDGTYKAIGCHILEWDFDNNYTGERYIGDVKKID